MTERWRLFIALPLPDAVRERLRAAQGAAREAGFAARWVAPESAHLTLKFLGDTEVALVESLGERLRAVVAMHDPFPLATDQLGVFPNAKRPRVLWLGLAGDLGALNALHDAIDAALIPLGCPREARPFRPHLTLGRLHERAPALPSGALVGARMTLGMGAIPFPATKVLLIRSELGRGGPRYTTLGTASLGSR